MKHSLFIACILATGASAQELTLSCAGTSPDWSLDLTPRSAQFSFADRKSDMSIPQRSTPDGRNWPVAMTLIAPRDSAIVIIHAADNGQHDALILTQRGEMPFMLIGSCV